MFQPNVILFIQPFYLNSANSEETEWRTNLIQEAAIFSAKYSEGEIVPILTDGRLAGEKSSKSYFNGKSGLEKLIDWFSDEEMDGPILFHARTNNYDTYPTYLWQQKPTAQEVVLYAITDSLKRDVEVGLDIITNEDSHHIPYGLSDIQKERFTKSWRDVFEFAQENLETYVDKLNEVVKKRQEKDTVDDEQEPEIIDDEL